MVTRPTAPAPESLPDSVRAKLEHDVIQAMASDDPAGELCRVVERTVLEHEVGRRIESGWCRLAAEISDAVFEVLPDGRICAIHGGRDSAIVNAINAASGRPLVHVIKDPEDQTNGWLIEMLTGNSQVSARPQIILIDGHRIPVRVTCSQDHHLPPHALVALTSVESRPSGQLNDDSAEIDAPEASRADHAMLHATIGNWRISWRRCSTGSNIWRPGERCSSRPPPMNSRPH